MCVCVYLSVFIHGRERIGHAQLVVASVGVRPASVPLSFHREHINVWATSPPTGNSIRALLCFVSPSRGRGERNRASFCASLNLHNYTVDNLSDIYRLLLLRNPTRLLRRLWPLIGIPEPLASSQTSQHIPGRSPDQGRGSSRIFFIYLFLCVCFKSSLARLLFFLENQVLCWARLSRSRDKYTISPPTFVRPRPPPVRSSSSPTMHPNAGVMLAVVLLGNLMLPSIRAQNGKKALNDRGAVVNIASVESDLTWRAHGRANCL